MAITKEEKEIATTAAQQVRDIASGLSGNRRYVLERAAGAIDALVAGSKEEARTELDPAQPSKRASGKSKQNESADSSDDKEQPVDKN